MLQTSGKEVYILTHNSKVFTALSKAIDSPEWPWFNFHWDQCENAFGQNCSNTLVISTALPLDISKTSNGECTTLNWRSYSTLCDLDCWRFTVVTQWAFTVTHACLDVRYILRYLRPCVTSTILTSWTTKFNISCPCSVDQLCQLVSKLVNSFSKYHVHKFGNIWISGCIAWTYGQAEKIRPILLPTTLAGGGIKMPSSSYQYEYTWHHCYYSQQHLSTVFLY